MPCIEIKSTDYTSHPKDSTNLNAYKNMHSSLCCPLDHL